VTLLPDAGHRLVSKPCRQPGVESCTQALVNLTLLKTAETILIPGARNEDISLHLASRTDSSAVFVNGIGNAAYFTWSGAALSGQVQSKEHSWSLEGCGRNCFSWVKQDRSSWLNETCETPPLSKKSVNTKKWNDLRALGEADTDTIVTYTVMMWFTKEFSDLFETREDLDAFTDLIILETNEAYINGNMPVRVAKHCVEKHPTMTEEEISSSTVLNNFWKSMSLEDLRNSADAAALLVADLSGCGIAYTDTTGSCYTLSVTKKSCATGYYSFGHEIGHNFGAKHNPEKYSSSEISAHAYNYGHGHLILPTGPSKYTGFRTILAYNADGHYNRVNRYSDPTEVCSACLEDGAVYGVEGLSNNAKVITGNRFAMAACGTEENVCSAPGITTEAATACQPKYVNNKMILGSKIKMKRLRAQSAALCWEKCTKAENCKYITWVKWARKSRQKKVCTFYSSLKKMKRKKGIIVGMCQ